MQNKIYSFWPQLAAVVFLVKKKHLFIAQTNIHRVRKKRTDSILAVNLDKIFIIFGTNHPDSPRDWKIVNISYQYLHDTT